MNVDTEPNEPHRIPELWFEDGNIVIQAGNSQFRVHRGILASCSPVFQDMLSFPQPSESELVQGCPLVLLHDSAADVAVFLRAIFDSSFFMPFPIRTKFDVVLGCLRLGHKYGVDYLRRRALIHLSSGYPTTLSELDTRACHKDPSVSISETISWRWPDLESHTIFLIELAREVEAPWILPVAFYNLSIFCRKLGKDIFHGTVYHGVRTCLSIQDQSAFINGHIVQMHSATTDVLRFLSHPMDIEGCLVPTYCHEKRLEAIESIREVIRDNPSNPLNVWDEDDWERLQDVCRVCLAALKTTHQNARQTFWDKLPELYGLPPWEVLEKMKVDAIGTDWLS
ncbi:hypothetical protein B0H11DRAFT_1995338 [Mycena galericulata]|nr:hypothetical protein B0H11DRAFT_1995338 [Mycena galericulata]